MLLRETEKRLGIIERFADCFTDYRKPEWIEHTVYSLVSQRVNGLALGYEDLNDHEELRRDPLMAVLAEREDVEGEKRRQPQDQGKPLAGKSTLNRLELTAGAGLVRGSRPERELQEVALKLGVLQQQLNLPAGGPAQAASRRAIV